MSDMAKNIANLTNYLSNPKNRQAMVNRQILTDFDKQETELRNIAKL
jgi:hypothetical protein